MTGRSPACGPAPLNETLPAVPESVPRLRRAVGRFAANAGAPAGTLDDVRLAVTEAATNVIIHAYVDSGEPGEISVTATSDGESVHVSVTDAGRGMVPRVDSPGLGLGLPLIAQAADTFDVQHGEDGGTELRMSFRLTA